MRKRLSRARTTVRAALLERFSEFARSSAPSAAFTSLVATALTVASPPAAALGVLSTAAAGGAKSVGQVLLGSMGGIALAVVAAMAGIWIGLRSQLRGALDDAERAALTTSAAINAVASLGFVVCIAWIALYTEGWLWPVLAAAAFMLVVFWQTMVVQPRAMRRRHAREAALDPDKAARDRRRERTMSRIGFVVGLACGLGGVILGLVAGGRF